MLLLRCRTKFALFVSIALLMLAAPLAVAQKHRPKARVASSELAEKSSARPKRDRDPAIVQIIKDVSPQRAQQTDEKLVSFGTRSTLSVNNPGAATASKGIVAARNWIKSEFERISSDCNGCLEVKTDTFIEQPKGPKDRITQPTEIQNVYAILKGTDPAQAKRIYLVTGHYDSRNSSNENSTDQAPGANDDGSGTAVSLECARVLSKMKFPATIIFLTVAGEEQGLNGSKHFAEMAKQQRWKLEAVLKNDIEYGDLPKFVNFDYVAQVARINAATLASLASGPAPPAKVKMLTKELDNDTHLTWEPSLGATAYEVVWRGTSSPDWEHVQTVAGATSAMLKVSKDNVIFGVRAVDGAGHRS